MSSEIVWAAGCYDSRQNIRYYHPPERNKSPFVEVRIQGPKDLIKRFIAAVGVGSAYQPPSASGNVIYSIRNFEDVKTLYAVLEPYLLESSKAIFKEAIDRRIAWMSNPTCSVCSGPMTTRRDGTSYHCPSCRNDLLNKIRPCGTEIK